MISTLAVTVDSRRCRFLQSDPVQALADTAATLADIRSAFSATPATARPFFDTAYVRVLEKGVVPAWLVRIKGALKHDAAERSISLDDGELSAVDLVNAIYE